MDNDPIDLSKLTQNWLHSHEEDTDEISVFRPASFQFPRSRGRRGFELHSDGTATIRQPGPTDRTELSNGKWGVTGRQLELSASGGGVQKLFIQSLEGDRLLIRKKP